MTVVSSVKRICWSYVTDEWPEPRTLPFDAPVCRDAAMQSILAALMADGEDPTGLRLWPGMSQFDAKTQQEG